MMHRRVIKVGGSCLSNPDLPHKLSHFLDADVHSQNLIIIGGGLCIDAMRALDQHFQLDQSRMHWRCVELLRTSFEVLGELLPSLQQISSKKQLDDLLAAPRSCLSYLIAVDVFYNPNTSIASGLPVGWQTTTDSIAAFLAKLSNANELVLLKSCNLETTDLQTLAESGIVDAAFPDSAPADIELKFINLDNP